MKYILVVALMTLAMTAAAQTTRVRGRVTDASTGEPVALVSIVFPGTTTGVTTDYEGIYSLETRDTVAVLEARLIGYQTQQTPVRTGAFNQIDFVLQPVEFDIDAVVVRPGANPAHPILRGVIREKERNDPRHLDTYACRTYTKMELDLANIKPRFRNRKLQKNFGFVFEHLDTSAVTGQSYLPVMISEAAADFHYRRSPALQREIIRASRISGVDDNSAIAQFTGHLHADFSLYDNYVELFKISFASPLSNAGLTFYDYYLVDSMQVDGRKTYKIRFHPKGVSTPVLDGEVNIDSATYALRSARVAMARGVNVNWLRHLTLECDNDRLGDSVWFPRRERMVADFSITKSDSSKIVSFLGSREVTYSDVRIGEPLPREVLALDNNVVIDEAVGEPDERLWDSLRPYPLSDKERAVYSMVDSVKRVPLYRNIYTIINTVVGGYYNTRYVGIGPYFKLLSFNRLEGVRLQLGARTTKDLSRRVRLSGYAAYGTRDERFKGGGTLELMLRRQLTRKLTLGYKHDVVQLGAGHNALAENNILSSILSRGNTQKLSMIDEAGAMYEHEWRHGRSGYLTARVQHMLPNRYVPMFRPDGQAVRAVDNFALGVGLRLSWDETVLRLPFDKDYLSTKYPVLTVGFMGGLKGITRNSYEYGRLEGRLSYRLSLPPIGYSRITVEGGHILGKVPYLLLKLHEGNGTYFYDQYAFSCMNFYEFASDTWVALFYEHHFNGFLLGKIPLIRKLNWREVLVFKGVYGTLSDRNNGSLPDSRAFLLFPPGMSSVRHPYMEMGFGVENIFRLLRVDCIWRLTHRSRRPGQDIQDFAVNFSLDFKF